MKGAHEKELILASFPVLRGRISPVLSGRKTERQAAAFARAAAQQHDNRKADASGHVIHSASLMPLRIFALFLLLGSMAFSTRPTSFVSIPEIMKYIMAVTIRGKKAS